MSEDIGNLELDPKHTALLFLDLQTEVVERNLRDESVLERLRLVLQGARTAGVLVVYVAVRFREGYPELHPRNPLYQRSIERKWLHEGSRKADIHPSLAPVPGEIVISKRRTGAFGASDLEMVLRAREITMLIVAGLATSGAVLSTVRAAADLDYDLVVMSDCCADPDEEVHGVLMTKVFPKQARVLTAQEVIKALAGA